MAMAGPLGEEMLSGKRDARQIIGRSHGLASDSAKVREAMKALGSRAHRWVVYQAAARRLVRERWPAIRLVAAELARHGRMNAYRLDRIIAGEL
jgi:hypothetical protein